MLQSPPPRPLSTMDVLLMDHYRSCCIHSLQFLLSSILVHVVTGPVGASVWITIMRFPSTCAAFTSLSQRAYATK